MYGIDPLKVLNDVDVWAVASISMAELLFIPVHLSVSCDAADTTDTVGAPKLVEVMVTPAIVRAPLHLAPAANGSPVISQVPDAVEWVNVVVVMSNEATTRFPIFVYVAVRVP